MSENEGMERPKRAYEAKISVSADSLEWLRYRLLGLVEELGRHEGHSEDTTEINGVQPGQFSNCSYNINVDMKITHEMYIEALGLWMREQESDDVRDTD